MTSKTNKENRNREKLLVIETTMKYVNEKLDNIEKKIDTISRRQEEEYITKEEFKTKFDPVKNIVYGLVSTVLVTVLGAVLSLVIINAK